jgi:hypothetical protein
VREICAWLRMQELQTRLDAGTGNRDRLRGKLDRRLEIIEALKQKAVDGWTCRLINLKHETAETKAETEMGCRR